MTDMFGAGPDATPIDPESVSGLIPDWIATQSDLNEAEQENMLTARVWAFGARRRWTRENALTAQMLQTLHKRMFGGVWRWAGAWRQRETNLGIDPWMIDVAVRDLCADVFAQTADLNALIWPTDEIAVRFHHRLVCIHPFANGNGRHARLAADLLVTLLHRPVFSWGSASLTKPSDMRRRYIDALRRADQASEFSLLIDFARS